MVWIFLLVISAMIIGLVITGSNSYKPPKNTWRSGRMSGEMPNAQKPLKKR